MGRPRRTGVLVVLFAVAVALGAVADPVAAAPPAAAAAPAWPLVSSGQQGPQVSTVQYLLRQRGETIAADADFGPQTLAAVKRFQTANGLGADGVVGPVTWAALVVRLESGASGEAVRALQTQLNRYGYGLAVDGAYGPATASAVTAFKAANGLGSGTVVDTPVWQTLVGGTPGGGQYALPLARGALPRSEYDDPHHDYPAIDLPVGTGTPAYAMATGRVITIDNSACGVGMQIQDANGHIFMFCHLQRRTVAAGSTVTAGSLVAYTDNTGNTTGPHLHIEIRVNGGNRCPQNFLLALYDGATPPSPASLPTSGCFYTSVAGTIPWLD